MTDSGVGELQRDLPAPARLSAAVYDGIVELIANGEFALNTRLPSEAKLSGMFKASRPVVREALARLREDGVVVSRQGSGTYVKRQPDLAVLKLAPVGSIADVQRCFEFRAGLEPATAALAALRWEPDDMRVIDECMLALEHCVRTGVLGADEDNRLHQAIADATHNQYHGSVQSMLRPHISAGMNITRSLSLMRPETRTRLVQDEHVAIVDAIRRRDPDEAGRQMRTHILNARQRMFEGVGR
jgi:GntR family transcriptional regulator, transcriptional repressor for pyruvate dehydrogenase complex